jgi:catechol 2,3-dioxygenase-like lactoylglutathione lyase family enzyme
MGIKVEGVAPLIQVFDMPRSVAFYRDVLGFEIVTTSPPRGPDDFDWGLLRLQGIHLMLNTAYEANERPPEPDPHRVRAHGDTALFFACPDVDAAYGYLGGKGVRVTPPVITTYGMKQLHLTDPDGYGICLQTPVSR